MESSNNSVLNIIHFNDVYDIEPEPTRGGIARFYTAVQKYSKDNAMTLFSGDIFSPSHRNFNKTLLFFFKNHIKVSTIHMGKQMIVPINKLNITASCFGNHEFVNHN